MAPRKERRLAVSGGWLIAIGVPLAVIGIVLALTAGVEQHARKGRPFA